MRCNVGDYKYKGFLIGWSDYYQVWVFEPTFLGDSDDAINFSTEYANDMDGFNSIKATKAYIKDNYDSLVLDCNKRFEEYKNN